MTPNYLIAPPCSLRLCVFPHHPRARGRGPHDRGHAAEEHAEGLPKAGGKSTALGNAKDFIFISVESYVEKTTEN